MSLPKGVRGPTTRLVLLQVPIHPRSEEVSSLNNNGEGPKRGRTDVARTNVLLELEKFDRDLPTVLEHLVVCRHVRTGRTCVIDLVHGVANGEEWRRVRIVRRDAARGDALEEGREGLCVSRLSVERGN